MPDPSPRPRRSSWLPAVLRRKSASAAPPAAESSPPSSSSPPPPSQPQSEAQVRLSLQRMSLANLRAACEEHSAADLLENRLFAHDSSSLRAALARRLFDEDDENSDSAEVIEAWLASAADPWPEPERPPPTDYATAIAPKGPWGPTACGIEVRACPGNPAKGRGAYATRPIEAGRVVGIYWGERLTQRAHALRHEPLPEGASPEVLARARPTPAEAAALDARRRRLSSLKPKQGAPMGGADNRGSYSFALLPDVASCRFVGRVAYLDAEDPAKAGWCRYINHAADTLRVCNCEAKIDALRALVWLQTRRAVAAGEELAFDYGTSFRFGWDRKKDDALMAASEGRAPPPADRYASAPPGRRASAVLPIGLRGTSGDEPLAAAPSTSPPSRPGRGAAAAAEKPDAALRQLA